MSKKKQTLGNVGNWCFLVIDDSAIYSTIQFFFAMGALVLYVNIFHQWCYQGLCVQGQGQGQGLGIKVKAKDTKSQGQNQGHKTTFDEKLSSKDLQEGFWL